MKNLKKIIALLLVVVSIFTLVACSDSKKKNDDDDDDDEKSEISEVSKNESSEVSKEESDDESEESKEESEEVSKDESEEVSSVSPVIDNLSGTIWDGTVYEISASLAYFGDDESIVFSATLEFIDEDSYLVRYDETEVNVWVHQNYTVLFDMVYSEYLSLLDNPDEALSKEDMMNYIYGGEEAFKEALAETFAAEIEGSYTYENGILVFDDDDYEIEVKNGEMSWGNEDQAGEFVKRQ